MSRYQQHIRVHWNAPVSNWSKQVYLCSRLKKTPKNN